LGFEQYLEVLVERPSEFQRLMEVNAAFCLEWASAQVRAGATVVAYYDPMLSPTCVPVETARELGIPIARRLLPFIGAPFAVHFASGHSVPLFDDLVALGAKAVGIGAQEDVAVALQRSRGRIGIIGNLNGVAMCGWSAADARAAAAHLGAAGADGGLIVADCHGEIPFSVADDVLSTIAETIRQGTPEAGD
jgi:uroporphyrinogen decarboxylase